MTYITKILTSQPKQKQEIGKFYNFPIKLKDPENEKIKAGRKKKRTNLKKQGILLAFHLFKNREPISSSGLHELHPRGQKEGEFTALFRREADDALHDGFAAFGHLWRELRDCLLLGFCDVGAYLDPSQFRPLFSILFSSIRSSKERWGWIERGFWWE